MCICLLITACVFRCLFDFSILMDAPYIVLFYGLHLVLLLFYFIFILFFFYFIYLFIYYYYYYFILLFYLISFYCDMDSWSDANK